MAKFVTIGERLSTTAPAVNKAFTERDPEPIIKRAKQQLDAGATYLDVNIGPAENDGEDLMKWAVQLLQSEFDNVPLALDTTNQKAIEAGISVYNRAKGKPIVNSADAGDRISNIDLAAANDAICIALCSSGMVAADNDERMMHCQNMLERGMAQGMDTEDLWFDPLFLVVKGMQDKQMEVLEPRRPGPPPRFGAWPRSSTGVPPRYQNWSFGRSSNRVCSPSRCAPPDTFRFGAPIAGINTTPVPGLVSPGSSIGCRYRSPSRSPVASHPHSPSATLVQGPATPWPHKMLP